MNDYYAVEVLLVEDNDDDANLAIRGLKKQNLINKLYRVEDGEEALDFIFARGKYKNRSVNNIPRLILLDLKMPKVDGLEVLRIVRADDRTKKIPIVVMTSSKEEKDITESYNLGVNSYIVKPVDFHKFAESIKEIGFYWLVLNQPPA
jgi:two-component system response regulator